MQATDEYGRKATPGECTCNATTILSLLKRDIDFGESIRGTPGAPGKDGKTGAPGLTVSRLIFAADKIRVIIFFTFF